jgi:hypothetical protein
LELKGFVVVVVDDVVDVCSVAMKHEINSLRMATYWIYVKWPRSRAGNEPSNTLILYNCII